jgi:hypothetical protein
VGAALFGPEQDAAFEKSVGGMMFPRGFVGAASYWGFNGSLSSQDPDFVAAVWAVNDEIIQVVGGQSCPSHCQCDQLSACGAPYIPAPPPAPAVLGSPLAVQACAPLPNGAQSWRLTAQHALTLAFNSSLCVGAPPAAGGGYPLTMVLCTDPSVVAWSWSDTPDGSPAHFIQSSTGDCMDLRAADEALGLWVCGTKQALQPNQLFYFSQAAGSHSITSDLNNLCVTAEPPSGL